MENIRLSIQKHYNYSDYQMKQLEYLFMTIFSELSKFIFLGILFHKCSKLYLFSMAVLFLLRGTTGGIHCKTYISCLTVSFGYLFLAIYILPGIVLSKTTMLIFLLLCSLTTFFIGPVTSVYRPDPTEKFQKKCKQKIFITIFFYLILMYLLPDNFYIISGFWIIILHTFQLLIAHILKGAKQKNEMEPETRQPVR